MNIKQIIYEEVEIMEQREMTQIIDNVVDSMVEKVESLLGDRIVSGCSKITWQSL